MAPRPSRTASITTRTAVLARSRKISARQCAFSAPPGNVATAAATATCPPTRQSVIFRLDRRQCGVPLFYSLNIIATVPDEMAKSAKKRDKMANTAGKMAKFWYIKGGRR